MRPVIALNFFFALLGLSVSVGAAEPKKSQDQIQTEYIRRLWQRMDSLEKKQKTLEKHSTGSSSSAGGDSVNLDAMTQDNARPTNALHHGKISRAEPGFKVFFDLNLVNRPNVADLSFVNFHTILLFELLPEPDLQFTFDIGPGAPRFYELDYQVSEKVQVRAGKIWIPFDDMAPHNIFGGRVNVSRLSLSSYAYLPDLWTDLGVGVKLVPVDSTALRLTLNSYVVNGFGSGGSDPMGVDSRYPNFNDISYSTLDSNRNKAVGGRAHALFGGYLGVGASFYTGRWTSEADTPKSLTILGMDSQLRTGPAEFRVGISSMSFGLPSGDEGKRGGYYGEAGLKFGLDQKWKALARFGSVQLDNRVIDITDQRILGATLIWKPGLIEYSLEHSRDTKTVPNKPTYTYTAARMVVAL